ncbi:cold-shock protein [Vibrio atypicus]|jgi:CspA family cold shock protein|uniref:cold-shock protein n=1 Tax=Vibrio atypicus TaxID=558271 RepID=UPI001358C67B|nr:cold shock domain-containing protein [Vibrio atypicus]
MIGLKAQISWFNSEKGFGFAVPDIIAIDVLIDTSQLENQSISLSTNQRVYLEVEQDQDGAYQAISVVPL